LPLRASTAARKGKEDSSLVLVAFSSPVQALSGQGRIQHARATKAELCRVRYDRLTAEIDLLRLQKKAGLPRQPRRQEAPATRPVEPDEGVSEPLKRPLPQGKRPEK
jgi:hypothetical protein